MRDLIDSGDTILSISGIFSGTLSWLFLQFDGSVPFTELVDQAWQQGLTEPDPRDDLSGKDVMRKLVILAREAGYNIEPDQVRVESLVPAHCEGGSIDHFFENGDELNEQMVQRLEAALYTRLSPGANKVLHQPALVLHCAVIKRGKTSHACTGY